MGLESQFLVPFVHKEYTLISVGCHVLAESHQYTVAWSKPVWDRVLVRPGPGSICGSSRRRLYCKHQVMERQCRQNPPERRMLARSWKPIPDVFR